MGEVMSESTFASAVPPRVEVEPSRPSGDGEVSQILRRVADRSGHDLTPYRRGPILRRLERRARESRLGSLADYAWVLPRTPAELDTLLPCLLGRSSRFFRAPAQLAALRSLVLEPLLADRRPEDAFRAWIIGCSTGEEAYSIAMLLLEVADSRQGTEIEIIATDVDLASIEVARMATYGPRIARDVDAGRLDRFFVRTEFGFRLVEDVRKRVRFATHDPLIDPPFPDLDLIVCRGLLDSLKPAPRREVFLRLQAGVKPGGALLIGPSEGRPLPPSCFSRTEARQRLFVRSASEIRADGNGAGGSDEQLSSTNARLEAANRGLRGQLETPTATNADLEALLGDRAAQEAVNQSREFVASVSHEIRTPLQVIMGYADILRDESSESQRQMIEGIRRSADGLLHVVGALLELSRLGSSGTAPRVEFIAPSALVREVIEEVRVAHGRNTVEIRFEAPADSPEIATDSLRLKLALRNLIDNAVKYGRDSVQVEFRPSEGGIEFIVTDRGLGIPLAEQGRIFEPFRRGELALRDGTNGSGLGLHLTRRLIESLGGSIGLESEPGLHCTFRLWIPNRSEGTIATPSGGAD
jgi:chemotaxis methyl-accepting protein methylase/nitrogen-specific signal transduction histidine kinase